ncbi:MAG: hypothetical protein EOP49_19120 [Sphingobacteriales bacterium]|nr:MAG: hypothetical protein EOP49_19120 [Sphingobacteriales bacterium]
MRLERSRLLAVLLFIMFAASCQKAEKPVVLPPAGASRMSSVTMGEDYEYQIFFDFESGQMVKSSRVHSWDLAFESMGDHVFINGGRNTFIYNTQRTNPASVLDADNLVTKDWKVDASCGLPDSTAIGDWMNASGQSKGEVYIMKMYDESFRKIVILGADAQSYRLAYGDISATVLDTITISRDPLYNFVYFSFDNGGYIPTPEPPKDTWDIVFTRYHYVYHDMENYPYLVCGVLLNPFNTLAAADSLKTFDSITYDNMPDASAFSNHRDVIGFDWKKYNFTTLNYEISGQKNYVVRTRKFQAWKVNFIDFYDNNGVKGNPTFKYSRIQ